MEIERLLKQRKAALAEARKIHSKAQSEQRDLTAEERAEFERKMHEADEIRVEIDEQETGATPGRQTQAWGPGHEPEDVAPGELRFLKPEERLVDVHGMRNEKPLDLGKLIAAAAGYDPDNSEPERRTLLENSDIAGGFTIPPAESLKIWDMARNRARIFQAGAQTIEMKTESIRIPRITQDPSGEWKPEGTEAGGTTMEFAALELHCRTLCFWLPISRELLEDAKGLDSAVRNALTQAASVELDRACLFGDGAGKPSGIYTASDVNQTACIANGYYDDLADMMQRIEDANLEPGAFVMSPRTRNLIRKLKDGEGRYMAQPSWMTPMLVTKQVSDTLGAGHDESCVFCGAWENLVVGIRTPFRLELIKEALAQQYEVALLGAMRCDASQVNVEAFEVLTGLTTNWG